eukprot:Phypoly_transcript_29213.p1 GENE.Phypoly_transcript_29213~~Phypoly_transcript_29213.p1  ORF type:complete len:129 (+),score=19.44 Phypoly_transcript_29213:35-388(+)
MSALKALMVGGIVLLSIKVARWYNDPKRVVDACIKQAKSSKQTTSVASIWEEWDDIVTCTPLFVSGAHVEHMELPPGTCGTILEASGDQVVVELYVGEREARDFFYCSCYANDVRRP